MYERFGVSSFTGAPLREVMVGVVGGPTKKQAGWQASMALTRLVSAGMVDRLRTPHSTVAWGHSYNISGKGLAELGVDEDADIMRLKAFVQRLSDRRVRISPAFINDPTNRAMLRLGVAGKWLQMVVSAGPMAAHLMEGEKLPDGPNGG